MISQYGQQPADTPAEPRFDTDGHAHPARTPRREWNATQCAFPQRPAHELFQEQVSRSPNALAVIFGEQTLSYRELNARANQLADYLKSRGVIPDTLVGVCAHRGPALLTALLAIWKAGGAYVPIDPTYPVERCMFMADDSAVHVLLADRRTMQLFPSLEDRLVCLDDLWSVISGRPTENPAPSSGIDNLAYVIYTSGSTGQPKGALIEHRGLVNYLSWAISTYGLHAGDLVPVHSSISFDLTVTSLYPALLSGGTVELLPEDIGAQSLISSLQDGVQRALVKITPAHLELLSRQLKPATAAKMTRAFIIGGENLTAESLRFWRETAPQTRLINEYGPTETVVGCCIYEVQPLDPHNGSVPIGSPIANTQLYVLDEHLSPVPVGETGELYISGAGVARGYLNRPELTRERFLPDRISGLPNARMYKTGDLARYRDDGVLEYLGRVDSQVKVRGYRVELGEIEATMLGHPDIRNAAVIVREITPGNSALVAYAVRNTGGSVQAVELRTWLKSKLPDYMVPSHCTFLQELPLTHNGKVDRSALPAPQVEAAILGTAYVQPDGEVETYLAQLWSELLAMQHVGADDDVFDLGVTSLMVVAAASRIKEHYGVPLSLPALFENSTVRSLASFLKQQPALKIDGKRPAEPDCEPRAAANAANAAIVSGAAATPTKAQLTPIRFGLADRELVGMYHQLSESNGAQVRSACLMFNPFGQEAVRSQRILKMLADRLARGGSHVLRFDYYGTGDSPGEDDEVTLEGLIKDALTADRELRRRSAPKSTIWFGVGLGATTAALASHRAPEPLDQLVLWDPVIDGRQYLQAMQRAHTEARKELFMLDWDNNVHLHHRVAEEAAREALGYQLTSELRQELQHLSLSAFSAIKARRVILVAQRDNQTASELATHLERLSFSVRFEPVRSAINWLANEMLLDTALEAEDIRTMIGLLEASA